MNDIKPANTGVEAKSSTVESAKVARISKQEPLAVKAAETEVGREELEQMVYRLNEHAQSSRRDLQFALDEETGKTVITVIDRDTSEVIRQLPNDVTLNLAKQLNDGDPIHLFSAQA